MALKGNFRFFILIARYLDPSKKGMPIFYQGRPLILLKIDGVSDIINMSYCSLWLINEVVN